jgi:hypothetical protein
MTKRLDPETRLRRRYERQAKRDAAFMTQCRAKPNMPFNPPAAGQMAQVTPRLVMSVSDWSVDEHGNPTRTVQARE